MTTGTSLQCHSGQKILPGVVVEEGFLDAPCCGRPDALVDGECLPQWRGAFAGVAVPEVALAGSFQCARFLEGHAEVAGDGQRLGVVIAGLVAGRGLGQQIPEVVQCLGLAEPLTAVAEDC
jgi:hypothetical protein